jgi:hypothetical protein
MASYSFDDTSDERELQRLAYSRPVPGVDPAAAQAKLAALAEARRPPPEVEWHPLTLVATDARREKLLLAACTAAALAVASVIAAAPVSSLTVFSVPQSGVPTWPEAAGDTVRSSRELGDDVRWLASSNGWDVFGFITTGGSICVATFDGAESAGGACTSRAVFEIIGLRMGTSRVRDGSTEYLSVTWGPTGGAQISDVPLARVAQ